MNPWHIRYIGEVATDIKNQNITLEEHLELYGEKKIQI